MILPYYNNKTNLSFLIIIYLIDKLKINNLWNENFHNRLYNHLRKQYLIFFIKQKISNLSNPNNEYIVSKQIKYYLQKINNNKQDFLFII